MTTNGTTPDHSTNRRTTDGVHVFHASDSLVQNLQKLLVDLIELHLQGKQAHWNLVGTNFRTCTCSSTTSSTSHVRPPTRSPSVCAPSTLFPTAGPTPSLRRRLSRPHRRDWSAPPDSGHRHRSDLRRGGHRTRCPR